MNFQGAEGTTWVLSDATYGSDLSFGVGYSDDSFMGATLTSVDEFHMVSKIILNINLDEEAIQYANPRWVKFSCNQTENHFDITTLNIDPEGVVLEMKNYTPNGPLRINVEGYGYEITLNSITVEYNKEVWHELQFNGSSPLIINWNERNTAQFLDLGYRDRNNAFIQLTAAELTEIRFTSSDESVATISNNGSITILKPGSTTIDANYPGNTRYYGQEAWYTLTVNDSENQLFGGGNGTYEAPYLISTPADLKALSTYVNTGVLDTERKYFYLSKDLDCSALTGFEPIGNATYPFKGLFAANYLYYDHDSVEDNHKITGLTCLSDDPSADVGLFGVVDKVGDFYCGPAYVRLENCTFGGGARNGAMVGYLSNGTIYCCTVVSCNIRSGNARNPQAGGMAGAMNGGRIANVSVHSSTITASTTGSGTADAGGLVGHIDGGEFLSNFSDNNTVISTTGGSTAYAGAFIGNISNNASGTFDSTYRSFYS